MRLSEKARNLCFIALGVAVLLLKRPYAGPFAEGVHNWGGNVAVSFALYFLAAIPTSRLRLGKLAAAAIALVTVEAFEATNGFGVMTNVYDPLDFAANAAGVGLALAIDAVGNATRRYRSEQGA